MTNKTTATLKDTGNVEAWSEVIAALLCLVPPDKRLEVLRLAASTRPLLPRTGSYSTAEIAGRIRACAGTAAFSG